MSMKNDFKMKNALRCMAYGGAVTGPGGPREDKVPTMLSDGEYVLPAATVAAIGKDKLDALRAQTDPLSGQTPHRKNGLRAMASGGFFQTDMFPDQIPGPRVGFNGAATPVQPALSLRDPNVAVARSQALDAQRVRAAQDASRAASRAAYAQPVAPAPVAPAAAAPAPGAPAPVGAAQVVAPAETAAVGEAAQVGRAGRFWNGTKDLASSGKNLITKPLSALRAAPGALGSAVLRGGAAAELMDASVGTLRNAANGNDIPDYAGSAYRVRGGTAGKILDSSPVLRELSEVPITAANIGIDVGKNIANAGVNLSNRFLGTDLGHIGPMNDRELLAESQAKQVAAKVGGGQPVGVTPLDPALAAQQAQAAASVAAARNYDAADAGKRRDPNGYQGGIPTLAGQSVDARGDMSGAYGAAKPTDLIGTFTGSNGKLRNITKADSEALGGRLASVGDRANGSGLVDVQSALRQALATEAGDGGFRSDAGNINQRFNKMASEVNKAHEGHMGINARLRQLQDVEDGRARALGIDSGQGVDVRGQDVTSSTARRGQDAESALRDADRTSREAIALSQAQTAGAKARADRSAAMIAQLSAQGKNLNPDDPVKAQGYVDSMLRRNPDLVSGDKSLGESLLASADDRTAVSIRDKANAVSGDQASSDFDALVTDEPARTLDFGESFDRRGLRGVAQAANSKLSSLLPTGASGQFFRTQDGRVVAFDDLSADEKASIEALKKARAGGQ